MPARTKANQAKLEEHRRRRQVQARILLVEGEGWQVERCLGGWVGGWGRHGDLEGGRRAGTRTGLGLCPLNYNWRRLLT